MEQCCKVDMPGMVEISRVVEEAKGIKSFFFKEKIGCRPGQFIMVWLPGVDEKPMAVSYLEKNEFAFSSHVIGAFTSSLDKLKKGDKVGIRGPYGNSFSIKPNACVVGGGIGISSVSALIDLLKNPIIINGARSREHLLFLKRYKGKKMHIVTDDGSAGKKGFTTDILEWIMHESKPKIVYACGPEIMMKKVLDICNRYKVECEASLERYMKCGFGICGNCIVDDQIICVEGPIYSRKQLNSFRDFGNFSRLKTGKKVTLKEYY